MRFKSKQKKSSLTKKKRKVTVVILLLPVLGGGLTENKQEPLPSHLKEKGGFQKKSTAPLVYNKPKKGVILSAASTSLGLF